MSDYTEADLVPFATFVKEGDFTYKNDFFSLCEIPANDDAYLAEFEDETGSLPSMDFNGWHQDAKVSRRKVPCRDGRLFAQSWVKDNMVIYAINCSPNQAGGYVELYVFAKKREDLEAFCKDVYPDQVFNIEKDVILKQTC